MYVPLPVLAAAAILFLVLVVLAVRRRAPARDLIAPPRFPPGTGRSPKEAAVPELPPEILAEVRVLVGQDRKIEAIKRVREVTHLGLGEAKDLVERL
jgi:hypothetical protein